MRGDDRSSMWCIGPASGGILLLSRLVVQARPPPEPQQTRWFTLGESVTIDGPLTQGAKIRMKGRGTGTITATIGAADEPNLLGWTSSTFGLSVISVWRLEESGSRTRVKKEESMNGLPARLLRRTLSKKTVAFMETWLRDLKIEAEMAAS